MIPEVSPSTNANFFGNKSPDIISSQRKEPERIARAVFVSPISVSEFKRRLSDAGGWNDNISLANVHLLQKSSSSKPSVGMIMAVGGTADPRETRTNAALREAAEETRSIALHEKDTRDKWSQKESQVIEFGIPGYDAIRRLSIGVLPVSSFALNLPREKESGPETEDKIAQVLTFSPSEFQKLVTEGSIRKGQENLRAAGHFTMASVDHDPIEITGEQRDIQRKVLTGVIREVEEFDLSLKRYTKGAINKIRFLKGRPSIEDLADCSIDEITTGFVAAQMKLALKDERAEEIPDGPNKKISLLRVLPYLTSDLSPAAIADLLLYLPTHETIYATQQLAQGFKEGVKVLINSETIDLPNKADLLEQLSQEGVDHDIDAIAVLREVWPAFINLRDADRMPLLKKASKATVRGLAKAFGVKKGVVSKAVRAADGFHDFMKNDLKGNGKPPHKYFQDFRPMNEITNAGVFTLMVHAIGYHPNRLDLPDQNKLPDLEDRILRFEALRYLTLVSVGIDVVEQIGKADNSLFEAALDTFFDKPMKKVIEVVEGQLLNVYDRRTLCEVGGRKLHVSIDEGLKKRVGSGNRKRFQDRELKDILPISIIVTDENFDSENDSVQARLKVTTALRDHFISHARERITDGESGWTIEIEDHRTKAIEEVQTLAERRRILLAGGATTVEVDEQLKISEEPGGKRSGSKGDAIIRDKFFMVYIGPNGERQTIEVNLYPLQSSKSKGVEWLAKAGKWGYTEWSIDNAQGNYLANRLTERSAKTPMTPTLAEDLYLPLFYAALIDKTGQLVTRKQKLNGNH